MDSFCWVCSNFQGVSKIAGLFIYDRVALFDFAVYLDHFVIFTLSAVSGFAMGRFSLAVQKVCLTCLLERAISHLQPVVCNRLRFM